MFERSYTLVPIRKSNRAAMTQEINEAVAAHDHPRAAAAVACMTSDRDDVYVLIEYWRSANGDSEQGTKGSVDSASADRKPRRTAAAADDHARAATSDQPAGIGDPVDARAAGPQRMKEEDVPLPFGESVTPGTSPFTGFHTARCHEWRRRYPGDCVCFTVADTRERPALPDTQIAEINALTRVVLEPHISDDLRSRGFTGFHVADCPYWINRDWADCHCHAERPALPDTAIEWP